MSKGGPHSDKAQAGTHLMASDDCCASIQVVQDHAAFHVWQYQKCFFEVANVEGCQVELILTAHRSSCGP
jgi:hypothetical protein